MAHWAERFLQIEYDRMNCAEFVEHVLREQFGRKYKFPQSRGSLFAETAQIKEEIPKYVRQTEDPMDGDLVLMHGKRLLCHVGIYVGLGVSDCVLHSEGRIKTSALHNIRDLKNFGYRLAGYYTWLR